MLSKRKIFMIAIMTMMLVLISTIFAYSDQNFKPQYGITTANVNLRKSANLDYSSIISTITSGTKLKMVGTIGQFYIVQLPSNQVGLISKNYIEKQNDPLNDALVYQNITPYYAKVMEDHTNVRGGPRTNFASYTKLNAGTTVQVIGKIENFSLVVTENNLVGMIRSDLIDQIEQNNSENNNGNNSNSNPEINEAQYVLELINEARVANGLIPLSMDSLLQATAQSKAIDMVKNNYFSHESPTYGSPFQMMQNAGIIYKTAGENIAGNQNLKNAVESWLASESHKKNLLSNAYNFAGIGVEKSEKYGYIIVAMFIGK